MILKFFIIISILFINNFAYSEEQFTKKEVKEFVLKAYNYMKENGKDKAFDEFSNPKGSFIKGSSGQLYIFALNYDGILLAHGNKPKLVGMNILTVKDSGGDFHIKKLLKASIEGGQWVEYNWYNPITKKVGKKLSFVIKFDKNSMVGAGIYESMEKKAKETVNLASIEFLPYTSKKLPKDGYLTDLIRNSFSNEGYETNIEFYPITRAKLEAQTSKVKGYFPSYECDKGIFKKSESIGKAILGFAVLKSNIFEINKLEDLSNKIVGKVKNKFFSNEFDILSNKKLFTVEEANNDQLNIQKLLHIRVDVILIEKYVYDYELESSKDLKDKIVFLDKFTQNKNLYICFNSNKLNNKILKDFNNGMSKINKDQFYFDYLIFNF